MPAVAAHRRAVRRIALFHIVLFLRYREASSTGKGASQHPQPLKRAAAADPPPATRCEDYIEYRITLYVAIVKQF
jgi:hypothetical protein